MNKSKARRRAIQAQRKKLKKEGKWEPVRRNVNEYAGTRWENLFEFQRTVIGYVTTPSSTPNRYYGMWRVAKKAHSPIKCQIEIMDD